MRARNQRRRPMRRTATVLTVAVLTVALSASGVIGGGGAAPPPPSSTKVTGPAVSGTLVIDPHEVSLTTKAKQGSLRLQKGTLFAGAVFDAPATFPLTCGCDLKLNDKRFLDQKLTNFVPSAIVDQLFKDLGFIVPFPPGVTPIITDINNATCTPEPENPAVAADPNGNVTLHVPLPSRVTFPFGSAATAGFPRSSPISITPPARLTRKTRPSLRTRMG